MKPVPKIVGEKCVLRPIRAADAAVSLAWRQNPKTREQVMGFALPVTEASEADWYQNASANKDGRMAIFAIDDARDQSFVGFARLANINWIWQSAMFGIVIGETNKRGTGLGREATCMILSYGFNTLNLRRIELHVVASNAAAIRLYESIGFLREGCLREAYFSNGRFQDVIVMGILRHEFAVTARQE
jgi:RimJ/RimL family protein N-acetyltransferase